MVDSIDGAALLRVLQYVARPSLSLVCASLRARCALESTGDGVKISSNQYKCIDDDDHYIQHLNCTVEDVEGVMYSRWWLRLRTVTEWMPTTVEGGPMLSDIRRCDLYLRFAENDRGATGGSSTEDSVSTSSSGIHGYQTCLGEVMSLGCVRQLELIHFRLRATPSAYMPFLALPQGMHTFRSRHTPVETGEFLTLLNANALTLTSLELSHFRIPSLQFIGKLCPVLHELELRGATIERGKMSFGDASESEENEEAAEQGRPFSDLASLRFLRRLDVSYLANEVNFSGIGWCTSIHSLNLASCNITNDDLAYLSDLANLEELFLSYTHISSLQMLTNYATLRMIQLAGSCITSEGLKGIENFTGLRNLDLTNTPVQDVGSVGRCWSLVILNLSRTKITNEGIQELRRLIYLEHLTLTDTAISSIAPLVAGAHALKRLSLRSTCVDDAGIEGIERLTALEDLSLAHTQVTDVAALAELTGLRRLDLFGAPVTGAGIQRLGEAPALQQLNISRTKVIDIQCLSSSTSLEELQVKSSWIRKTAAIAGLGRIPTLTSLTITNCKVNNVSCLDGCDQLRRLSLWSTKVTTDGIAALRTCVGLTEVDLGETSVNSIAPLCGCLKLESLKLSSTPISSIAGISALRALVHLDLSKTQITSIDDLADCALLEELNVSNTPLTDEGFATAAHLVSLRQVLMAYTSVSRIGHLGACPYLEEILAVNSPITSEGLVGLERATELKKLNLSFSSIQCNIRRLAQCKKMEKLNLKFTDVSVEEIEDMKKHLPKCRLTHDAAERAKKRVVLSETK